MQLKNDIDSMNELLIIIVRHYKEHPQGWRSCAYFPQEDSLDESRSVEFLVDRRSLAKYTISPSDRGAGFLGGVTLAIGPRFFGPADFWAYEASERFRMGTHPDDIVFNLRLLDEFLGFKHLPPK